ncbi:hypothetical protein BGZ58_010425, partial [Dissophora ornata]
FIEEQGLIKMMINHGLAVEMTAEEFETGHWQRAILEADRQAEEEKEGRRLHMESCCSEKDTVVAHQEKEEQVDVVVETVLVPSSLGRRSRRSASVSSMSAFRPKAAKIARLSPVDDDLENSDEGVMGQLVLGSSTSTENKNEEVVVATRAVWFERRIPNNGGEVCARLVEEFMAQLDECEEA